MHRPVAAGYITSTHRKRSSGHWSVWWTHQRSPLLPPASASCCTWGKVCYVPARLSSKWWGSSAGQRRWAGPRACVGPGGGGPVSRCVQPLNTLSHLKEPAGGQQNHLLWVFVHHQLSAGFIILEISYVHTFLPQKGITWNDKYYYQ